MPRELSAAMKFAQDQLRKSIDQYAEAAHYIDTCEEVILQLAIRESPKLEGYEIADLFCDGDDTPCEESPTGTHIYSSKIPYSVCLCCGYEDLPF